MDFVVSDVMHPIISMIQLQTRGITSQFGTHGCHLMLKNGNKINLVQGKDSLAYFVPRGIGHDVRSNAVTAKVSATLNVITTQIKTKAPDPYHNSGIFKVFKRADTDHSVPP